MTEVTSPRPPPNLLQGSLYVVSRDRLAMLGIQSR
jgi:hypothetical protein